MFRFRLQQVLDLREQHERALATQLAQAMGAEREAQATLDGLRAVRVANGAAGASGTHSIGELTNLAFILDHLDGQIASANDAVTAASQTVAQMKDAVTAAFQDRRMLDRLRDRQAEAHRTAEGQLDQRTMDDIALTRYTQQGS
jgi:flagellar FliJ protein